jgi:hypothetical protein
LFRNQCVFAKDEDGNAIEHCRDFAGKRFIRRHATDARQQSDPAWDLSKLNHLIRFNEISFLETGLREPKLSQDTEKSLCVIRRGPDKNLQVPCVTWAPMEREALRADDHVTIAAGI